MSKFYEVGRFISLGWNTILAWRLSLLLVLCVVLGGTSQDILTYKIPVYLISLIFIGQVITSQKRKPLSALWRPPVILAGLFLALFILYVIPLPPSIWSQFEGREIVIHGYNLAEIKAHWLPLSLTPEKSLFSLFDFIPIIAIVLIMQLSTNEREFKNSKYAVIAIAMVSLMLGLIQNIVPTTSLHLYSFFNKGYPVGFFSNVNHQACLLTIALTLAVYLAFGTSDKSMTGQRVFAISAIIMLFTGTLLTGSAAGYLFLIVSLVASTYVINRGSWLNKASIATGLVLMLAIFLDFFLFSGQMQGLLSKFTVELPTSRLVITETALIAQKDFGIWGTGPGSFSDIYRIYENKNQLSRSYVNEAHNDYLQVWFEMGIFGALIILAGLFWFLRIIIIGFSGRTRHYIKLSTYNIAATIPILHSTVDYPLRTIAISAIFIYIILFIDRLNQNLTKS